MLCPPLQSGPSENMTPPDTPGGNGGVTRLEYEEYKRQTDRRLEGHDTLYERFGELEKALARFTASLDGATQRLGGVMQDQDGRERDCKSTHEKVDTRLCALEKWRWMAGGAIALFIALPTILAVVMLINEVVE